MSNRPLIPANRDSAFSAWLDLFRALAAFAVLWSHARTLFLASATGTEPLWVKALYVLSGYGRPAVMVFFVLSGYLVGGTVIRACRDGRWSWGDYLLRRGTRLYVVLIPALVLTLCWDYGERVRSEGLTPNNDTAIANIRSETIREHTSAAIFAGNVMFLQDAFVPPLGSNTPLWSLTNEFWYYLVFPMIWLAVSGRGFRTSTRIAYLATAALIFILLGRSIALYFLVWLLGVGVALLPEIRFLRVSGPRWLCALASVGVGLVAPRFVHALPEEWQLFARGMLVGIAFASLLYCLKHNHRPTSAPTFQRVAAFFADFSYTLYLVHLPPLIFLRACWTYEVAWPPVLFSWLLVGAIVLAVVLYAYLISLVTERQTDPLRRWLVHRCRSERREPRLVPAEVST